MDVSASDVCHDERQKMPFLYLERERIDRERIDDGGLINEEGEARY